MHDVLFLKNLLCKELFWIDTWGKFIFYSSMKIIALNSILSVAKKNLS